MCNAWLVRPVPHGINRVSEFKNNNIIAIGWPCIGDLNGKSREELKTILSGNPYCLYGLALGNAYATVDIFINQMSEEDLILMPDGDDIYFGMIKSDYIYDASVDSNEEGYPHQRKVKWLANCSRKDLSMELRTSLKVHRTAANLSHHYEEIAALSYGTSVNVASKAVKTIEVSYPLRPDFSIKFNIPDDITKDEAQRLSDYFSTLYFN